MPSLSFCDPLIAPANGDILISRLDERVDSALLGEQDPNLWKPVPYETESYAGVMLGCGDGDSPVPITVRLGVQGTYRIWLGIHGFLHLAPLRVRLTRDLCCHKVVAPAAVQNMDDAASVVEVLWKDAELSGQDMVVESGYATDTENGPSALAYIRLESIPEIPASPAPRIRHQLTITNDGHGIFGQFPHSRAEDLLELFEDTIPEDSGVTMLLWGNGDADICNYPTKVGNYFQTEVAARLSFHGTFYRNMKLWRDRGWDSLTVMRDYARRRQWEFQVYVRIEAFDSPYPFQRVVQSDFFHRHPECHCLDREGRRVQRLSYACPAVQDHMLALFSEISGYEPDGLCLALIRGMPMVLYEPIMVEGFRKRFQEDPRSLPEEDPRWLAYQADIITAFMRRIKPSLKPGQRLSVIVPANEADCRRWGLDVATWVSENLVDDVLPVGQRFDDHDVHRDDPDHLDFDYFNRLPGRSRIRLIPMLYPWEKFQADYPGWRQQVVSFLERGADGYAVWDAAPHIRQAGYLGLESREESEPPERPWRKVNLLTLEGFRCDRYHYFEVV